MRRACVLFVHPVGLFLLASLVGGSFPTPVNAAGDKPSILAAVRYQTQCAPDLDVVLDVDDRESSLASTMLLQASLAAKGEARIVARSLADAAVDADITELTVGENEGFTEEDLRAAQEQCSSGQRFAFIAIITAPTNALRRAFVRKTWLNAFNRAALGDCIQAKFFIGHETIRTSGGFSADADQLDVERQLQAEQETYGDILRVPFPEAYANLPDKTIAALSYGLQRKYPFIAKLDDDWIPSLSQILSTVKGLDPKSFVYAGTYFWPKKYYDRQAGADHSFHPYFNGKFYVLSSALVEQIVVQDSQLTAKFLRYGSSSEDVDMGHWVHHAAENAGKEVNFVENRFMCQNMCVTKCPLSGYNIVF